MTMKHEARRIMPDDPIHWLERILPMVRANSKPGSRVKAAFETLEAQWPREDGPTWGALHLAAEAWGELAEDEKQKILNGWRSRGALPKSAEAFGWIQNSAVANVLRIMCEVGGEVAFEPDIEPDAGIMSPVQLIIREGTDEATVLASIRVVQAAVVTHFKHAITLRSTDDLTVTPEMGAGSEPVEMALAEVTKAMAGVRAALQHPEAAGLEPSSDMIPVGTLVADPGCKDSGIVVGAFRGTSGTLYVYMNARGQANSQYEAGLEWQGKRAIEKTPVESTRRPAKEPLRQTTKSKRKRVVSA